MIKRISKSVKHQGIGGKEFIVDEAISRTLTNDTCVEFYANGNWACRNFIERRPDFKHDFPYKLFYVKIDNIGYVIAEDEIEVILEPEDIELPKGGSDDQPGVGGAAASVVAPVINDVEQKIDGSKLLVGVNLGEVINGKDLLKEIEKSNIKSFISGGKQ